jgi:hypothetical protein
VIEYYKSYYDKIVIQIVTTPLENDHSDIISGVKIVFYHILQNYTRLLFLKSVNNKKNNDKCFLEKKKK